jgi:2-amino-4-hydroxy-6-hydroxymethyldihydropteridine diphosphokinase
MAEVAYLSLGSNVGDRAANLAQAIARMAESGTVGRVSAFYETQPVDLPDQPWFLNCALALETRKSPADLLKFILQIESEMGRVRTRRRGPRKIDIDIVLFGEHVLDEPGLKIPHPAMHQRRFVLEPLVEIAPEARHPIIGKTARELLAVLPANPVVRRI